MNEASWLGDDDDDENMIDYYVQQNIIRLNRLYIENDIKLEDEEYKIDLDQDVSDAENIFENFNDINVKLSQKALMNNIENKQFHDILNR